MRALPVYFLIDVSDSMAGEPIAAVQKGLDAILARLRQDPYALETMRLATLVFAGRAEVASPLADLVDYRTPQLHVGSGTSLGAGLELLMERMTAEVRKTTREKKGDWKPIVFLFTDGVPTDDPVQAIRRWQGQFAKNCELIIVTFGDHADMTLLRKLSDTVLTLTELTPQAFRDFFRWVSASLEAASASAAANDPALKLPAHSINLQKSPPNGKCDENFAILPMRCSQTGDFWLAKYARAENEKWQFDSACATDAEMYQRLSAPGGCEAQLALADADVMPPCPICGSDQGVVRCACGRLACWPLEQGRNCPWCGTKYGEFRTVDNMNVARSRG